MASQSPVSNLYMSSDRVVAFFRVREDAFRAISEMKEAGYTSSEIGLVDKTNGISSSTGIASDPSEAVTADGQVAYDDSNQGHSESMWEKLKHFFSGDSADDVDYRDSTSGMNWDQHRGDHYYRGIAQGGALITVTGARTEEAREILQDAGGDLRVEGFEEMESRDGATSQDEMLSDVDVDLVDEKGFAAEDIDEESTSRLQDRRVQLRGEVLRNYRERTGSRETPFGAETVQQNRPDTLTGRDESKVVDPDGDLDLDGRAEDFKKPAA